MRSPAEVVTHCELIDNRSSECRKPLSPDVQQMQAADALNAVPERE